MSNKIQVFRESDSKIINTEIFLVIVAVAISLIMGTNIHPAIGLVLALLSGVVLFILFRTAVGFIIVSTIFSLTWGWVAGSLLYNFTQDWIWTIVVGVLAAFISYGSHNLAKRYHDNVEEV